MHCWLLALATQACLSVAEAARPVASSSKSQSSNELSGLSQQDWNKKPSIASDKASEILANVEGELKKFNETGSGEPLSATTLEDTKARLDELLGTKDWEKEETALKKESARAEAEITASKGSSPSVDEIGPATGDGAATQLSHVARARQVLEKWEQQLQKATATLEAERVDFLQAIQSDRLDMEKLVMAEKTALQSERSKLHQERHQRESEHLALTKKVKDVAAHTATMLQNCQKTDGRGLLEEAKRTHAQNSKQHWDDYAAVQGQITILSEELMSSVSSHTGGERGGSSMLRTGAVKNESIKASTGTVPIPDDFMRPKHRETDSHGEDDSEVHDTGKKDDVVKTDVEGGSQQQLLPLGDVDDSLIAEVDNGNLQSELKHLKAQRATILGLIEADRNRSVVLHHAEMLVLRAERLIAGEENLSGDLTLSSMVPTSGIPPV